MIDDILNGPNLSTDERPEERRQPSAAESAIKHQASKQIRKRVVRKIEKKLAAFVAKQGATTLGRAALTAIGPWGWVIIAVIIVLLLLIYMFKVNSGGQALTEEEVIVQAPIGDGTEPAIAGITVNKTGPDQIEFGQEIEYSITVNYDASLATVPVDKIIIIDKLPTNTEFVSASGTFTHAGGTVEWPLNANQTSYDFSITLTPSDDDIEVVNTVFARSLIAGDKTIDSGAANLEAVFNDAGQIANVPPVLLKAISSAESAVLGYSSSDFDQFNSPNWWAGLLDNAPTIPGNHPLIVDGYGYNTCQYVKCFDGADVRGAMQVELQTWNEIKSKLGFTDGHDPDRRYPRDIIYAAAYFLRDKINTYDSRFNFSANLNNLSQTQIEALAKSYCAGNPDGDTNDPACSYGAYEKKVWAYYQANN